MAELSSYTDVTASQLDDNAQFILDVDGVTKNISAKEISQVYSNFTSLSGSTWDGSNKVKTLTSNTTLSFSAGTNRLGQLIVIQDATGGRTLTIGGNSVSILSSANAVSFVSYIWDAASSKYRFFVAASTFSVAGTGPDTTPPTMVSATATSATTVVVVFDETVIPTVTGWTIYDSTTLTTYSLGSVTGSGTTWTFTIASGSLNGSDTYTINYFSGSGNTTDTSGNELADIANASVTNGIGSSWVEVNFTGDATEVSTNKWTGTAGGDAYLSECLGNKSLAASADGALRAKRTSDSNGCIFGFKETNAAGPYSAIKAGFTIVSDGSIYKVNSGTLSLVANPGVVNVNDYVKVVRTGSAWKLQYSSDGSTWNDFAGGLGSLAYTGTGQMYSAGDLDGSGAGFLYEPMGFNVS